MAVQNFTSREFRSQQAHVFDLADRGERVIIRRQRKAYAIVPVDDSDLTISPELQAKIDKARQEYRESNTAHFDYVNDLHDWMDSL